jgi:NifU-like protein involved in Fe-S cluster formation
MNEETLKVLYGFEEPYFGLMNDLTASASNTGPCGDTMEVSLMIRDEKIEEVKYYTDGCGNTRT